MYQSFTLRASTNIHNLMFRTILRAPMVFFDTTPLGRILNRFAVDMDIIDYQLPDMSMQAMHNAFMVLGVIALISAFLHYMPALHIFFFFLILFIISLKPFRIYFFFFFDHRLLVPMAILFFLAQHYYRNANRDIKRIDSASKSPLFQHLSATLSGLPVLRAFRQEPRFTSYNEVKVISFSFFCAGLRLFLASGLRFDKNSDLPTLFLAFWFRVSIRQFIIPFFPLASSYSFLLSFPSHA